MIPMTNMKGQIIGYVNEKDKTYETTRYMNKGQVFNRKQFFGNKFVYQGIAIDKALVLRLQNNNIEKVVFTIIGIEKYSYNVFISVKDILQKGIEINYDRRKDGVSYTGYGTQLLIDLEWCTKINHQQKKIGG